MNHSSHHILFIAFFVFAFLLPTDSAQAASRVFYDGFEDGTTNAWSPGESSGYYAKCDVVSSALDAGVGPVAGTKMARCNWDGTQGTYGHRSQELIKSGWSGNEFLIRWKVRYDTDVDHSIGSKLYRGPGATSYAAVQGENYPSANLWSVIYKSNDQQVGSTNWGCGPNIMNGQWHEIEIYFLKSGSGQSNGTARIWVDGSFCWEAVGENTDDPQGSGYWNDFHLMSNWSNNYPAWPYHDANNHVYWDEFEIYSDTGSGATGSMSAGTITQGGGGGDTTPPTGVAITVPSSGATVSGASVTLTSSCTDETGIQGVQFRIDGTNVGAQDTSAPYSITWDSTTVSNAGHNVSSVCTDTSSNPTTSANLPITVSNASDTTNPVVSMTAPTNGATVSGSTVTVSATCTDNVAVANVQFRLDGGNLQSPDTVAPYSITWDTTNVGNGSHSLDAICTDTSSNTTTATARTVTVSNTGSPITKNECASPPAGSIFCNDFDTAQANDTARRALWDDYDGATDVNFPVNVGPMNDGTNHVAQFRVAAGQSGGADLVKVLGGAHDKLYARWYMKYETGFNFNAPLHGGGLALGSRNYLGSSGNQPNGSDFAYFNIQHHDGTPFHNALYAYSYYPGMYQDCPGPGSCFGDSLPCVYDSGSSYCTHSAHVPVGTPPTVTDGPWYCVESMVDAGTTGSTGALGLWLGGTPLINTTGLNLRSTTSLKIENLWLSLYHHDGTHSTAGMLFDNVVVGTQQIGCGGGGGDTTAPAAPTGLVVQ